MTVKIFNTFERETTSIPITEVLSEEGVPNLFPEITAKGYFDIDYRRNQLVLVAGKFIGLIPINERVAINVQPKVGIPNLVHILSKSRESLDSLEFFERYYKETSSISPTIFEFFVNCLLLELKTLEMEGMYKQYIQFHDNLNSPSGKINLGRTAAMNWSRGRYFKVVCDYFDFTADTHFNRMIKFTLWYCINHLITIGTKNKSLISSLGYYYNYFGNIPIDKNKIFLSQVIDDIHHERIPILRQYYVNLLKICRCLIEDIGIMLTEPGDDVKMLSFIINMERVFERYLLFLLRDSNLPTTYDIKILDGNKEGKGYLFRENRKYEVKPDIVLASSAQKELIIDVKYKKKCSESDRYQIISHALGLDVRTALLALPCSNKSQFGLKRLGQVGSEQGIELYEYYFDLENEATLGEESKFIESIKSLCSRKSLAH